MNRCIVGLVVLAFLLQFAGCSGSATSDEPPFSYGEGQGGDLARSTKLVDLALDQRRIVYEVQYPLLGLSSTATLDFPSKAMMREEFPSQWVVFYEYHDIPMKMSHVPTTIAIYRYTEAGDHVGSLINRYTFGEATGNGVLHYTDAKGRERIIKAEYFDILP